MLGKKKLLVHGGARDRYQLALALCENNLLKYLVTDDYILRRQKPAELNKFVKTSYCALILSVLYKVFPYARINIVKDQFLSRYANRLVKNQTDIDVIAYSYYASYVFSHFKGKKILFQLHPHPVSVRNIFLNEIKQNPLSKISLIKEHELIMKPGELKKLSDESQLADCIIVSSGFTKRTLVENGIKPEKITIVPYGVDQDSFKQKERYERVDNILKVIFVGSWNQRKGLSYLAQAIKDLQLNGLNIHLTLVGRGIMDKNLVLQYELNNVEYLTDVPFEDLIKFYHQADVFALPSLCEGFGHVILEAMSCGLPVITTENTAGADIILEGVNGFIVPVNDVKMLSKRLSYLYDNPKENIEIGKQAAITAKKLTWEKFRDNIVAAL